MSLKDDIDKTVEYAKSYGCVLRKEQVIERLIGSQIYLNPSVPAVAGTSPLDRGEKLKKAKRLAKKLSIKFPNILFIGVTGSVAAEFPKKNDDIDLFIIVKKDTLWITRFWVRYFVWKNKIPHRRYGKIENKDEFCFNMWLDEEALLLPKVKQNLHNAVDLVLMKKVYDKENVYLKFIKTNNWANKYVATPYFNLMSKSPSPVSNLPLPPSSKKRGHNFFSVINILFFIPQYIFMWPKMRGQIVDLKRAMWGEGE